MPIPDAVIPCCVQVLKSSNEVVEAIKSEMRDCVQRVSKGRTLLELAGVFQVSSGGRGGR